MRRLARHLFTLYSAVSLLLCVAVVALWLANFWGAGHLSREGSGRLGWTLHTERNQLAVRFYRDDPNAAAPGWYFATYPNAARPKTGGLRQEMRRGRWRQWAGWVNVDYTQYPVHPLRVADTQPLPPPGRVHTVYFPHWLPFVLTALIPGLHLTGWHRSHRRATLGLCRSCGYDLRASPGRCPECGTAAAATAEPPAATPG